MDKKETWFERRELEKEREKWEARKIGIGMHHETFRKNRVWSTKQDRLKPEKRASVNVTQAAVHKERWRENNTRKKKKVFTNSLMLTLGRKPSLDSSLVTRLCLWRIGLGSWSLEVCGSNQGKVVIINVNVSWSLGLQRLAWRSNVSDVWTSITNVDRKRHFNVILTVKTHHFNRNSRYF